MAAGDSARSHETQQRWLWSGAVGVSGAGGPGVRASVSPHRSLVAARVRVLPPSGSQIGLREASRRGRVGTPARGLNSQSLPRQQRRDAPGHGTGPLPAARPAPRALGCRCSGLNVTTPWAVGRYHPRGASFHLGICVDGVGRVRACCSEPVPTLPRVPFAPAQSPALGLSPQESPQTGPGNCSSLYPSPSSSPRLLPPACQMGALGA